jgi:DNA mismatch endonuclease Vsr
MDRHTKEQRRRNMQAIKSIGSKIETILAQALWAKGFRYRKNNKKVFGKPDFTFKKYKIAVFVDGEFFHGKDWEIRKHDLKSNHEFWFAKIERNMRRDTEVNDKLTSEGWKVLRFWGKDIKKNLEFCVSEIEQEINRAKNEQNIKSS